VLCEFRARLLAGVAEERLLHKLLYACQARGLLKARGRQRTDATHVLAAIRTLNRLEVVGETLRAALNALATAAPTWLQERSRPAWFERYTVRIDVYRLPKSEAGREALAATIGADGHELLAAVFAPEAPVWLRALPAIKTLRQVWVQQFCVVDDQVRRTTNHHPAAACIRPTTPRPCAAPSAGSAGSATRCT
jgi:hypothetical protein